MKRLLILLAVIMAVILIKRRHMEKPAALNQEQTIEVLKKEIKQLRQVIAETEDNKSLVDSR